jgi:clan AA aspartic protease
MAPTRGTLDPQGCPLTRVTIFPEDVPARGRDFDALIDTGFTGFAQMPQATAVDIGLPPTGTMDLTFSDGSTETMPVAWASIRLEAETNEGFVFLSERSEEVLLGIHFLRVFNKTLTFSVERGHVELP